MGDPARTNPRPARSRGALRVLVAPDSFKGSLAAPAAAEAIAAGFARCGFATDACPLADGGEGTAGVLAAASGGRIERRTVAGPLGEPVCAEFAVLGDGETAVVEMAAASGLGLVAPGRLDPLRATTRGTGELVRAALDLGLRRVIVALGGSATNDGGSGAARALGARFLDDAGRELPDGGASLARLARIDVAGLDPRLREAAVTAACDVDNPLCGPRGASAVFGPQKGATPAMVAQLDAALRRYAQVVRRDLGVDVLDRPGAGAAGGLGGGLHAFCRAELRPGVDLVLDAVRFADRLRGCDLVVTGEGRIDGQTEGGKLPLGVARAAKRAGVPCLCLAGDVRAAPGEFAAVLPVVPGPIPLAEAMSRAGELLSAAAERAGRLILLGRRYGVSGPARRPPAGRRGPP
jgi:glycerate kinase